MSREIKFRAWNERTKHFSKDSDNAYLSRNDNGIVTEQYTGLKDKNGKEIYEGDILQIDDHILGDFEVIWHSFGWKIKRVVGYESLSVHKPEDCTIIGNIHENPELLEKEEENASEER